MISACVCARLGAVAAITAIVSTRIFIAVAPQDSANPLIVVQAIGAERVLAMGVATGLAIYRVQVTSWADTYTEAASLAAEVRKALHYWNGSGAGVTVEASFIVMELDRFDDDTQEFGVTQEFSTTIREV